MLPGGISCPLDAEARKFHNEGWARLWSIGVILYIWCNLGIFGVSI
jgi:hypothetical protein